MSNEGVGDAELESVALLPAGEYAHRLVLDVYPLQDPLMALLQQQREPRLLKSQAVLLEMQSRQHELRAEILAQDPAVTGFNVGMNAGAVAGQTIFHCHVHLIPRRAGDVKNPRGGVRHVIPGKGFY